MPTYGARRVPGLRREEIAMLAGVSTTYYTRLEQGQNVNASESVLDALARALALNPAERAHLFNLARPNKANIRIAQQHDCARPGARRLIESMRDVPAIILGRRSEVLAWNRLGHMLVAQHYPFDSPDVVDRRPNLIRMLFADAPTRRLYARWDEEASRAVASLRLIMGRYADDVELVAFARGLRAEFAEFANRWDAHPIDNCVSGMKLFDHPAVGSLELDFEALQSSDESGHRVLMYNARPGTGSAVALAALRKLAATAAPVADEPLVT